MYLLRTEFQVPAGNAAQFEARQTELGKLRTGQPGYLGQSFLHSYGDPRRYVNNSRWENVEAAWAFAKSDALASYIKSGTPGLATITRQDGYESVFEVDAEPMQDPGTCEILVDWTINLGAAADFEQSRRELFELRKQHSKGFRSNRLRRHAGNGSQYLILQMYSDITAGRAAQSAPEIRAFAQAHPSSRYAAAPNSGEAYYVIHRM
jgi:heme-degrading monooxygenase HmoA